MVEESWLLPPSDLTLAPDEVQVWRVNLALSAEAVAAIAPLLDAQERDRADRLRQPLHQHRFIASHAALRLVLSRYLDLPPDRLTFCYSDRGKPTLVEANLQFNLSHSGDIALIAVRPNRLVGVDVEQIRPIEACQLAKQFFHPTEAEAIAALPPPEQQTVFFRYWTAKEAYLKAIGVGIANHLQEAISAVSDRGWSQWELIVAPHYAAAVATQTQGSAVQLCCWQWDWSQSV